MSTAIDKSILEYLKSAGPRSEFEIAEALKVPPARIRSQVEALSSNGDIICCALTRFEGNKKIEGISCRLSCYTPPPARGRKPGVKSESAA